MSLQDLSAQLAVDTKNLADLRREARSQSATANKEVARQFEALFLQTVLKAMRDATPQDGMFDSEQTRFFQSMHDQQLAQSLATRGGGFGLAALIEKQLSGQQGVAAENSPPLPLAATTAATTAASPSVRTEKVAPGITPASAASSSIPAAAVNALPQAGMAAGRTEETAGGQGSGQARTRSSAAQDFVERVRPHAFEASRKTGIPAHFMIAQAALETGWGKSEPRLPDGGRSHNLFGIKAGKDWLGPRVEVLTHEVVSGVAQSRRAAFRVYASEAEAFQDYARLLTNSPRYAAVPGTQDAAGFAQKLQQAGYATDPRYAEKLTRLIDGSLLRGGIQSA